MTPPVYPLVPARVSSRRSFVTGSASLALAALACERAFGAVKSAPKFSSYPFTLGVASGDPTADGMVLWTRLAPKPLEGGGMEPVPVEVSWQVSEDEGMTKIVRQGTAIATPEWGHSVHVEVDGLRPERWYWYQFKAGGEVSPKGRTRTFPAKETLPEKLRFAFASCQHFETGLFTAYEHMAKEDLDLVVHLGDYIYEKEGLDGRVRKHTGPEINTLEAYRNRHAQYKGDPALQAMHAIVPWLVTWDDHEVDNNYASDISEEKDVKKEDFLLRRAAAYQAYYEHMPLRRSAMPKGPDMLLYRNVSYGRLADFHVLDTRQYRSDQPCGDGSKPLCAEALNPNSSLLGVIQRDWLFEGLAKSPSTWNVLAQQVMMGLADRKVGEEKGYSMDQWPSCEMERRRILKYFDEQRISNPVVLTGDIHSNWANNLLTDFDDLESKVVATEFVGTSISSGGDGLLKPKTLDAIYAENPFVKFHSAERGYVSCEVTPQHWKTNYQAVEYVTRPGAPLITRTSFAVEAGKAGLQQA
ncbi:alkaline phosphatase D family protein [Prosthecobacter dejongeii]|uniref:Alkaline phosphatase D n=1 Tax=Prosthecobacter dejongeii TaxID=48465 RepID=A0A7W7YHT3_9BACT|nr:alkaline phosphatase D family protein [Prosthecobacter dejongeii]MBB5036436.1 alkaline phosphatase D [Prosthecobacter dejongeii]